MGLPLQFHSIDEFVGYFIYLFLTTILYSQENHFAFYKSKEKEKGKIKTILIFMNFHIFLKMQLATKIHLFVSLEWTNNDTRYRLNLQSEKKFESVFEKWSNSNDF